MTPTPPTPADGVPSRQHGDRRLRRVGVLIAGLTLATAPFVAFGLEPSDDASVTSPSEVRLLVSPTRDQSRAAQSPPSATGTSADDEAAAVAMAVLADPYTWGERSVRVAVLQEVLGETVDGWYGSSTLRSHRRALEFVGGATDGLPVAPRATVGGADFAALRQCESGGNYAAVSASGRYRGAYQFSRTTWNGVAEEHDPSLVGVDPAAASPAAQDAMAAALYSDSGRAPWPVCGRRM